MSDVQPASIARLKAASTFGTYSMSEPVVPPSEVGAFCVLIPGNSSLSMTIESPMRNSAWPELAAGRRHAHDLARAERAAVERQRAGAVVHGEVRRDRAVALRDRRTFFAAAFFARVGLLRAGGARFFAFCLGHDSSPARA